MNNRRASNPQQSGESDCDEKTDCLNLFRRKRDSKSQVLYKTEQNKLPINDKYLMMMSNERLDTDKILYKPHFSRSKNKSNPLFESPCSLQNKISNLKYLLNLKSV